MADPTRKLLVHLKEQFENAFEAEARTVYPLAMLGTHSETQTGKIEEMLTSNNVITLDEASRAMRLLGQLCGLWSYHKIKSEELRMREFSHAVISQANVPNPDVSAREAANGGLEVAKEFDSIGFRRQSAIAKTNAAMRLLRIEHYTMEDARSAVYILQSARNAKKKHGIKIDLMYTEFNYAIALRRLADQIESKSRFGKYKHSWLAMQRALKMAANRSRSGRLPPVLVSMNVVDIILNWTWETRREELSVGSALGPTDTDLSKARAIVEHQLSIASNEAEETQIVFCQWELDKLLSDGYIFTPAARKYLDFLWAEGRVIDYTQLALNFVPGGTVENGEYVEMLKRLVDGIKHFRGNRDVEDVSKFILEEAVTIRQAGSVLAFAGEMASAVEAFEVSKGLVYRDSIDVPRIALAEIPSKIFVYLAHCPDGVSCVIASSDGGSVDYDGFCMRIEDMSVFNSLFIEVDYSLDSVRSVTRDHAKEILEELAPIADFIESSVCSGGSITIIPMGYFQAFPVHALRASAGRWLSDRFDVVVAPSADSVARIKKGNRSVSHGSLVAATSVPDWENLPYSEVESDFLHDLASPKYELVDPFGGPVLDALTTRGALHYSGHSFSHPDPWQGGLVLRDGVLTTRRLFEADIWIDCVFLNSCESGHSYSLLYSEEFITCQSILFYKGANAVIGSVWPVSDRAALAFSAIFYECLDSGEFSRDWRSAFADAVRRLRRLTVAAFNSILKAVDAPLELQILGVPDNVNLFAEYRYWAPFSLMSRDSV